MIKKFLDENDDWIERFRSYTYPRIHPILEKFGGYGVGIVTESQYVVTVKIPEEELEEVLVDRGWERNPIACYKEHVDDRKSEGSWRLREANDEYGLIEDSGKQLHVTLFNNPDGDLDIYCHEEYDWQKAPLKHLREVELDPESGSRKAANFVKEQTYLEWYDKNER